MSSVQEPHLHLEVGHILFLDIVGYSKLLADEQKKSVQELNQIVRETEQFRTAEAAGKLTRLPTGDGMVLVFTNNPEAPVECALEISKALHSHPKLKVRIGIHSGPVNPVADVNDQSNLLGAGINVAQRVMSCGDAGHILLSKHFAEDLEHYAHWRTHLHDVGKATDKHGLRVPLVNLYTDQLGNSALPAKLRRARTAFRLKSAVVAALLLIMALGVGFWMLRRSQEKLPAVPAVREKSIAVLPFENLSRDPDNAYFVEGMQDEILARLSKIADLKVISRTSTQRFKSAPGDLREIARQLGVANILEGSVQKAADQVHINVQLINALNDAHLWSDIYDRKLDNIFSVEGEVAAAVAEALKAKLTGAEKQSIAAQPTTDLTAYDLYLKGRLLWSKRGGENLRQAMGFYEQAIARDPNYALAYAGMAEAYVALPWYGGTVPYEAYQKAKTSALRALQLDDKLAEAHTALAIAILYHDDLATAGSIREFQRAIALNPNYANAHHWYGLNPLVAVGRFDEAIAEGKRAIELDPLSSVINADLGRTLTNARRYDEAVAQLRKTLEIDPTFYYAHYSLGIALQLQGDVPAAIAEYTQAQQLSDDQFVPVLIATARAQAGDKEAAKQMLTELEELSRHRYVRSYWRALLYLSLGNRNEAIQWLEKGVADHEGVTIIWVKVDPLLDPLRGDPRFEALVQKVVGPKQK